MQSPTSARWPQTAIVTTVILGLLVLLLGGWAIFGNVRLSQVNAELASVRSDLDDAQGRLDDLEDQLEEAQLGGGLLGGLLGGEEGSLGLEDLLGALLSGDAEGMEGLGDLLGGLLGGESGDLGDLGGLFGGLDPSGDLSSCLLGSTAPIEIGDEALEAQVADIARAVEDLRGLTFPNPIDPTFVGADEMAERVRALVEESYTTDLADFDTRLLVALGLIPPDYDLLEAQLDLLDSGVAGYYEPETGELVVAANASDRPLSAIDQVTLAHELIHAVTDARLGFPPEIEDPKADPEIARAQQALIEGDATLGMQQFSLGALSLEDQMAMLIDPRVLGAQQEAGDFPYVLSQGTQIPYIEGMNFACSLYGAGGWSRVDAAYDNPPTDTSQILFPERYLSGFEAANPAATGSPPGGWVELRTVGFGAVDLLTMFSAPGNDPARALSDQRERTRSWAGGEVTVWSRGADSAVGITLVDSGEGPHPLCESLMAWELAAFPDQSNEEQTPLSLVHEGEGRTAVVRCQASNVWIGIGPDRETAGAVGQAR